MSKRNGKPKYQLLDPLNAEELAALKKDIERRGVLIPIEKDEDGNILDGHNRKQIAEELGIPCPEIVRTFTTEQEKREHVIKINLSRRHLEPLRWGRAFKQLLKERGVHTARGPKPDGAISDTMSEIAEEVGAEERTARRRLRLAEMYDSLPPEEQAAVDAGKKTVHKAARSAKKKKKLGNPPNPLPPDCKILVGDCLEHLPKIDAGTVRLAFADPPYNIGIDYGNGKKADLLPREDFLAWCQQWMEAVARTLTDDGSFWVLINDENAAEFKIALETAGLHLRQWLIWYESFGVNHSNGFNRTHRHLFWMVKNPKKFVFNPDAVNRPSDRQKKYNDGRADPGGKTWDSVWGIEPPIPRLTDTAEERLPDFPTQLPLTLLRAIVGCASEPGDLVLDPFSSSATTGVAALESGRSYIGIEKNPHFVELSTLRLKGLNNGTEATN